MLIYCFFLFLSYEIEINKYLFVNFIYVIVIKWGIVEFKIKVRNWKWFIYIYCIYIVYVVEIISLYFVIMVNND